MVQNCIHWAFRKYFIVFFKNNNKKNNNEIWKQDSYNRFIFLFCFVFCIIVFCSCVALHLIFLYYNLLRVWAPSFMQGPGDFPTNQRHQPLCPISCLPTGRRREVVQKLSALRPAEQLLPGLWTVATGPGDGRELRPHPPAHHLLQLRQIPGVHGWKDWSPHIVRQAPVVRDEFVGQS